MQKTGKAENLYNRVGKYINQVNFYQMKKVLLASIALVLAIGFSAYKAVPSKERTMSTFVFIGSTYNDANYDNPANWQLDDGSISCPTPIQQRLCKIDANPDSGTPTRPDFSGLVSGDHVYTTTNTLVVTNKVKKVGFNQ